MLNVVIGLVLIFLLYSLFATTILELLASFLSLRGRNLEKGLRNMLNSREGEFFQEFRENPLYKQLAGHFVGKTTPPSYLPAEKFRSILYQIVGKGKSVDHLGESIEGLPEGPLKTIMKQLWEDARHDRQEFDQKVERWFNDVMDRASGWYKRNIQRILIVLGLGIAVAFNVDSLKVYRSLAQSPEIAQQLSTEAEKAVEGSAVNSELYSALSKNIETLNSPLGIGWNMDEVEEMSIWDWAAKAFGWLVTAMAISLGAPFWFDLLRKMVNIRGAGKVS
jgi:hypothetical protein